MTRALRQEIVDVGRRMNACGLNQGTSGNVSARLGAGLLVTPSAMAYETMSPADIVEMDLAGTVREPGQRPSSEWRIQKGTTSTCRVLVYSSRHCLWNSG